MQSIKSVLLWFTFLCLLLLIHMLLYFILLLVINSCLRTKIPRWGDLHWREKRKRLWGAVSDLSTYLHDETWGISFPLCLFTLTAPKHICVTSKGGGGLERGAEIDRKLYTEDLDSLTGGIFFSPPTYSAYKGAPIFSVPALRLCHPR